MNRVEQSHAVLDRLRLDNGMYLAAGSSDYHYVWLRDSFYEVRPYLYTNPDKYIETYRSILQMLKNHKDKIKYHTQTKPVEMWEYIHARFDAEKLCELDVPWGHAQHDAVGAILFGIAEGIEAGHFILQTREDWDIVQDVVNYLGCCEYWEDKDNGMWEEYREVHSSSVGAVVAALKKMKELKIAFVKDEWIEKGEAALEALLPWESETKPVDLAQLSLIYPYNVVSEEMAKEIVRRVEGLLLRKRGVLRYEGDSYYSTHPSQSRDLPFQKYVGTEAEWTFGLPWLSLCHMQFGDFREGARYILWTESVMLEDGSLPELYFANQPEFGPNTPLGWSNAMYLMAFSTLHEHMLSKKEKVSSVQSLAK